MTIIISGNSGSPTRFSAIKIGSPSRDSESTIGSPGRDFASTIGGLARDSASIIESHSGNSNAVYTGSDLPMEKTSVNLEHVL